MVKTQLAVYNGRVAYLATFYTSLGAVLLMIGVGFLFGKLHLINQAAHQVIANLLLFLAMPCALFAAFPQNYHPASLQMFLFATLAGAATLIVAIVLAAVIFPHRRLGSNHKLHQFAYIFNNASFLGYPLVVSVFSSDHDALIYYSGLMLAFNLALFSYGVYLVQKKVTLKQIALLLLNPNIIAVCLGLLGFIYSWQLPEFLRLSITAGKNLTTPLSLLAIGFLLSLTKNWREILSQRQLFFTCLLQLLLMPTTTFLLLYYLHAPETMILMFTMIQALPTATSLVIFSEKYHNDKKEAAKLVLISTLLSLLTLPVVMTAAICILTF